MLSVKAMENVQRDAIVSWIESGERGGCQGGMQLGQVDSVRSIHFCVASLRPLELSGL